MATNPVANKVYIAANVANASTVTILEGTSSSGAVVAVGSDPSDIAVNSITNKIYVVGRSSNSVTVIDGATNFSVTVPVGRSPQHAAVNSVTNKIYVSNSGDNSVTVIDGATNSTSTIATGGSFPSAICVNPASNKIYVANQVGNSVVVIDGLTKSISSVPVGITPVQVAVNPVTNKVYVANSSSSSVTVIDGATNSTQTVSVQGNPAELLVNPVSNIVFVTYTGIPQLTKIDGVTNSTFNIPLGPTSDTYTQFLLAMNLATNQVYMAANYFYTSDQSEGFLLDIDGQTDKVSTVEVFSGLFVFAVNPVTDQIYVSTSAGLAVIDTSTTNMGSQPAGVVINPVTDITPLLNNQTTPSVPGFTFTASSTTGVSPQAVFYQFDTVQGSWTQASGSNPTFVGASTTLQPGSHTLYAYATDGQESTSQQTGTPTVGAIQAYTFLVVPAAPAAQSITFPPISAKVAGVPLTLMATASSGLSVGYSSSTPTVCSVSGSVATLIAAGTCTVTASQSGNANYSAAQPVTQSFTVSAKTPVNGSPVISNVQAVAVGGNSAVITWVTDQPSTSQVLYGATSSYGQSTAADSSLVTSHLVTVSGLTAGSTYNYAVVSANSSSASTTSPNSIITISPYVGYVAFWGVSNSGVTISWSTDVPANSFVAYGTSNALGQLSLVQSALSNAHGVALSGLNAGTTYYFRAESTTANGSTGASTLYSFTTTGSSPVTAPVITNVTVTNITTTSATITWTTDQAASSQVNYGLTSGYGASSQLDSSLVTGHSVALSGLTPGTTYDFDVVSASSSGTGTSANYNFVTTTVATPPVISNIQTSVTSNSATITWTTDQTASSQVNYGATAAYGSYSPVDSSLVTSHSVTLSGLTPGTTYNFDVVSGNAANLAATSPNGTFVTSAANATPPYVGYVAFWGVNNSGVTISWSTDVPANTELAYGTTSALEQLTPVQAGLANSHGVVLTGLNPGTTYYFVAESTGANGATGYSTTYSFTTGGAPVAAAPVISHIQSSVTGNSATITWTTNESASSQVSYGVTTTYTSSSTLDPTLVTSHSVTLTNLSPGTSYDFEVMSANSSSVSSTSTNYTFQTTGSAAAPVITSVASSSITSGTALITWSTDQATTSQVNYGLSTASTSGLVTSHSVMLTGLTPGTNYSFSVTSTNASGVSSTSGSYTFTTAAGTGTAPLVSYVGFWGITSSGISISWSTDVPANTAVAYGTTSALGQLSPVQTALTNSHGVVLSGLQPSTTYYFVAQSADGGGNVGYSTTYSFTTLAGAPSASGVTATPGSNNTATIGWVTNVPTYSYVQYGPSAGSYNRYSQQTSLSTTPQCTLPYVPSGTVHYQLVSTDAYGNQYVSPDAVFVEP